MSLIKIGIWLNFHCSNQPLPSAPPPANFVPAPTNVLNKSDSLSACVFLFVAWAVWNCLNGPLADCPIVDMILLDGGLDTKS